MDKLLKWSIAQQSGDQDAINKMGQPDPKMLHQLFGGPDEPTLMKHSMAAICNEETTEQNKEIAFENFEMLIENMDNANNIENLNLWPSLIEQLAEDKPAIQRVYAASCIGISVQNNPKAQDDFSKHDGLSKLINICSDTNSPDDLLAKSLFAISSYIRNFKPGYEQFVKENGWDIIRIPEDNHKLTLRVLSLVSAVLSNGLDKKSEDRIHEDKIIERLTLLMKSDGHIGCIDKILSITSQLSLLHYEFSSTEIAELSNGLENIKVLEPQLNEDYHSVKKILS
ncbi:uncharacterized protein PRCAT00001908001 [Priceomyces carsonii]|uniref:uncharacterized protein n=1 Tax=Priceomyces carsonii TaxID=28549 RepID=UPI002ED9CFE4|nr:unnamed protein product [Priceomyces carsonii]